MKTCENCGEPVYNLGCVNCNEAAYIEEQEMLTDLYGLNDPQPASAIPAQYALPDPCPQCGARWSCEHHRLISCSQGRS